MYHVVTVDGVLTQPVTEAEEQLYPLVGMQLGHVLAPLVNGHSWRDAVAAHDLVLFQVDMDGVRPISRKVGQEPVLHAVLLYGEAEGVAIHELTVDRPLPVQAIELEGPHYPGGSYCARQRVELLLAGRQAVVLD